MRRAKPESCERRFESEGGEMGGEMNTAWDAGGGAMDGPAALQAQGAAVMESAFTAMLTAAPVEQMTDPNCGDLTWRTLISSDQTPSSAMVIGVAELRPNGFLASHRHEPPEFYFGLTGGGVVEIDGRPHAIAAGVAVYIPGGAQHSVSAAGEGLSFLYGFPRSSYTEVQYAFCHLAAAQLEAFTLRAPQGAHETATA
ncbi:MAG: cupin domain-containing protein [Pseudomonadota bacterium]